MSLERSDANDLAWSSAARLLSGRPKPLSDLGEISDAKGWKVSLLLDPVEGRFGGLSFGMFGLRSVARCEKETTHLPPVVGCECGFHALYRRPRAEQLLDRRRGLVLLEVELYGRIVLHRDGSRSEEQDVHGIHLAPRCATLLCRRVTEGVRPFRRRWITSCRHHGQAALVSVETMRDRLGVDVSLFEPVA